MEEAEAFQVGVRHLALREGTIQTNAHFTDGELRPGRASLLCEASISHGSAQPPLGPSPFRSGAPGHSLSPSDEIRIWVGGLAE